jgi:regulator of replication initiation timing
MNLDKLNASIGRLRAEIDQLRAKLQRQEEAKRLALTIANERSKENVELRAENARLRAENAALRTALEQKR